jgi:hypothetical protein
VTDETDDPFAASSEVKAPPKEFGKPYNGRYHMPLLPGEVGTKDGGNWVPKGLQRMTNLVGAIEDTRALNVWEQAMALIGLALAPELYEELTILVQQAMIDGVDFTLLREHPTLRAALAGLPHDAGKSIVGRAKDAARAGAAAQRGTNRHTVWEHRGATGTMIGTPEIQGQMVDLERLLAENGLERVPGLSERIVRNVELRAVGKFDDILREIRTGRLLVADLKTKSGHEFFSWLTVDAQLAGYANAEWMLQDGVHYIPGPKYHVDLTEGVILHVPSDGGPAHLDRADLVRGWEAAKLARQIVDHRSDGKSAGRHLESRWIPGGWTQ